MMLKCEKIEKWCLLKLTGRKGFVKGSHCSKFQSVKQLFRNHLGLRLCHSPIYKYGRNGAKKNGRCSNI